MKIGTRSVLYGAHCFFLHPWFVAWAWWQLYGFPWDPRLWVAFFVHDLGYVGKPNMDGPEGETHVEFGARVMEVLFGRAWGEFCRYHSRFYAKRDGHHFSRLCVADKLAIALTPAWLYLPMVRATGEISEYMRLADTRNLVGGPAGKYAGMNVHADAEGQWYANVRDYVRRWAYEHRDGRDDTWTPTPEVAG
ncbi:MAG: hypothetical protein AB1941_10080 [Gemmatimonadota bacterium]